MDRFLRIRIGISLNFYGSERGILLQFDPDPAGDQNGQLSERTVCVNGTTGCETLRLGQIQCHMSKAYIRVTLAESGQGNHIGFLAEDAVNIKSVFSLAEATALGGDGLAVMSYREEGFVRLTYCFCQKTQTEKQQKYGKKQVPSQLHRNGLQLFQQIIDTNQTAAQPEKGEFREQAKDTENNQDIGLQQFPE